MFCFTVMIRTVIACANSFGHACLPQIAPVEDEPLFSGFADSDNLNHRELGKR